MIKVDIFSGFLGAGKTTLIKKLIAEVYAGEKIVLIENEFGEIGVDGSFMQEAGIVVNEMNSGCICCSLVGDFGDALMEVIRTYSPDRILIEPSGVGKLSDITRAVEKIDSDELVINSLTTVVDAKKAKIYMKNFGEFFNNQVESASCIILSRTDGLDPAKLNAAVALLKEYNPNASMITTPWSDISGKSILAAMEKQDTLEEALKELEEEAHHHEDEDEEEECHCHEHHHHHHHDEDEDEEECHCHEHHHHHHHDEDDDEEECHCHEHHHHHGDEDEEECHCHEHHHHDDDDEEECHCHEHHHHHDDDDEEECHCHEHHHHHHHGHDADEVFVSWGIETPKKFSRDELEFILGELNNKEKYGDVLRSKGVLDSTGSAWLYFDFVPEESEIREGAACTTGRICVIGSGLKEAALAGLFGV